MACRSKSSAVWVVRWDIEWSENSILHPPPHKENMKIKCCSILHFDGNEIPLMRNIIIFVCVYFLILKLLINCLPKSVTVPFLWVCIRDIRLLNKPICRVTLQNLYAFTRSYVIEALKQLAACYTDKQWQVGWNSITPLKWTGTVWNVTANLGIWMDLASLLMCVLRGHLPCYSIKPPQSFSGRLSLF